MPKSGARPGYGCLFKTGAGSPVVYTTLAEVVNIPGVGTTHRTDEVTHMTSPNGWVEHIGLGVKEGKAFTLDLNFVADSAAQIALYQTAVEAGTVGKYQIAFTDIGASTLSFEAIIQDVDISHERDAAADLSITVLPTGGYTWA